MSNGLSFETPNGYIYLENKFVLVSLEVANKIVAKLLIMAIIMAAVKYVCIIKLNFKPQAEQNPWTFKLF